MDGVNFKPVCEVNREDLDAASLERPVILPTDSGWRIYISCATPDSKHWWIDSLDAELPEELPFGDRHMVLVGDDQWAVKDPVIIREPEGWRMWMCCHPLTDPGQEDRMITRYATSVDGLHWRDQGVVLRGTPGGWDARGARITAILRLDPLTVLYDGRATAAENSFERTGLAREQDHSQRSGDLQLQSPRTATAHSVMSAPSRSLTAAHGSTSRLPALMVRTI